MDFRPKNKNEENEQMMGSNNNTTSDGGSDDSFESMIQRKIDTKDSMPAKLNISVLKFYWQSGLFASTNSNNIPVFLRHIEIFKNFRLHELKKLSEYLHHRTFEPGEVIFRQGDRGTGLYLVLSGEVNVSHVQESTNRQSRVVLLKKYDHFGELALLQSKNVRTATAVAEAPCRLLGIFIPDLEEMLENDPTIGAKLLQSLSCVLVNKLSAATEELRVLGRKLIGLQHNVEKEREREHAREREREHTQD
ncbi:MAG: cyclic nucleotide-binding domain-containing protein [Oligoflexia bacterium]|nr:cyclic nucleotide-binding domain-containing protein [Oligoflexia bacterium]MBF0366122.1 cyclic nucleotide-binding domain-containing protein [Oligoflexia bacterium]